MWQAKKIMLLLFQLQTTFKGGITPVLAITYQKTPVLAIAFFMSIADLMRIVVSWTSEILNCKIL